MKEGGKLARHRWQEMREENIDINGLYSLQRKKGSRLKNIKKKKKQGWRDKLEAVSEVNCGKSLQAFKKKKWF